MRNFLFLLLAIVSTPTTAQTFGETRQYFADWLAACRPSGYCSATAYDNPHALQGDVQNRNGTADNILRIGRHKTATYWEVSLSTISSMPAQYTQLFFDIDGDQTTFEQDFGYGAYTSINDFFLVSSNALPIIDKMARGNRASARFQNRQGGQTDAQFSLSGLSAALLWIDEQQTRLGSERVAYAAPIGLTPVSQDFPRAIPSDLIIQHAKSEQCDQFEDLPGAHRVIVEGVNDGQFFYLIPCIGGAYNLSYLAYVGDNNHFSKIHFAQYDDRFGWKGTPIIVNPVYDRHAQTLKSHYFGRGIGDCGHSGTWVWDEFDFAMIEFRQKSLCDGQGEPGVFPIVFQSTSHPPMQKPS